jgi:hypothetical protein
VVEPIAIRRTPPAWSELSPARLISSLPSISQLISLSAPLNITAPGVKEEAFEGVNNAYRFRYTGLRFLNYTGGRYVLVSDGWTPRYGVVILVSDKDPVRLEFVRGLQPSASPNP